MTADLHPVPGTADRAPVVRPNTTASTRWEHTATAPVPARAAQAAAWVGWHVLEIGSVTAPAVVAVTATPWAWLVSTAVAAGWAVNELRARAAKARREAERHVPRRVVTGHDAPTHDTDPDDTTGGVA